MKEIGLRAVTGAGLVVLVLIGTLINTTVFFVVFGAIAFMCMVEYTSIIMIRYPKSPYKQFRAAYSVLLGMYPFLWSVTNFLGVEGSQSPKVWILYIVLFMFLVGFELFTNENKPIQNLAYIAFGSIYIGISFALLVFLMQFNYTFFDKLQETSPRIVLGIVLLVYMNDSMAFVFGKWKGKHLLFPRVSPKKTWEGAIGGGVFTFILAGIYPYIFFSDTPHWYDWLAVAALVSIFGVMGDLIESILKRSFQLKDSEDAISVSLLPGHGGFLDRYDGFIFVVPFITMYFIWMYL